MSACLTSIAALSLAMAPMPAGDASVPGADSTNFSETDFDASKRLTVEVKIADTGPHDFMVDTGSQRTVVSAALAAQLGLTSRSQEMLTSLIDRRLVDVVVLPRLVLGNHSSNDIFAPVLLGRNIGADGILGLDTLVDKREEIQDFGRCLVVADPEHRQPDENEGASLRLNARERAGQLVVLGADLTGFAIYAIVDTGAQMNIGNTRMLRLLQRRGGVKVVARQEITSVTGAKRLVQVGYVESLKIGDAVMKNLAVAFLDSPALEHLDLVDKPTIMLGMNTLSSFERILIDFSTRQITFILPDTNLHSSGTRLNQKYGN